MSWSTRSSSHSTFPKMASKLKMNNFDMKIHDLDIVFWPMCLTISNKFVLRVQQRCYSSQNPWLYIHGSIIPHLLYSCIFAAMKSLFHSWKTKSGCLFRSQVSSATIFGEGFNPTIFFKILPVCWWSIVNLWNKHSRFHFIETLVPSLQLLQYLWSQCQHADTNIPAFIWSQLSLQTFVLCEFTTLKSLYCLW